VVDEPDLQLRRRTYAFLVEHGRAPVAAELGDPVETVAGWRRLHAEHAVVLNPGTDELRMLNPFSVVPTAYRVQAAGRWWYGNCAWDAFGICAALHADGRIETSCPDCGARRWSSSFGTNARTTIRSSSTSSSRRCAGGTTSSSPEAG
jgi:hypothetical protein